MNHPYLKSFGGKMVFMVKDQPMILLAGEVHNSNASAAEYMEQVWQQAKVLEMNSLFVPVSWEMIERTEGIYDFFIVDSLIGQARRYDMKLVFLWFGAWKNAECMYAPAWVKKDLKRFPRAEIVKGEAKSMLPGQYPRPYTTLSAFGAETCRLDSLAFAALLAHIRDTDCEEQTVVGIQVENETGLLGAAREHSDYADGLFSAAVPEEFVKYMQEHRNEQAEDVRAALENPPVSGSWAEVFGDAADEIFQAYEVAAYVEQVAKAGKAEYALPMLVNCWLNKPGEKPGEYPSGGPVARMHPVWRYAAPSIDVFCPDIYVPFFCDVCDDFTENGNPLVIPETATHSYAGAREVYVIGHHHAAAYSPFGFEDMGQPFNAMQSVLFGMDVADPALKTPQSIAENAAYNRGLRQLMPLLLPRYGTEDLQAVCSERPEETMLNFGSFGVMGLTNMPMIVKKTGVCLGVKTAADECWLLCSGCLLALQSLDADNPHLDILDLEEGRFEDGTWHVTRRLNGDEAAFMKFEEITLLHLRVHLYH